MEMAADNGIISRNNTKARPADFITKSEALAIVMQAAGVPYTKNMTRTGYSEKLLQWQIDVIAGAEEKSIILSGYSFGANDPAYREDVFKWIKNIISVAWTHEGIDLYFKNVSKPETLALNQTTYTGTFDFCVS